MPTTSPKVTAYITDAPDFARPILAHLRAIVHEACPDVVEHIKWGMPSLEHKGPMCGFAAFKQHCVFGFWKHKLLFDGPANAEAKMEAGVIAEPRGRIASLKDLPPKRVIVELVKRAAALNDAGVKVERVKKPKTRVVVPRDLASALKNNANAAEHFAAFSYSKRKDYVEWLTDAKTPETRAKRLATAVNWISQGKGRNWKYERC